MVCEVLMVRNEEFHNELAHQDSEIMLSSSQGQLSHHSTNYHLNGWMDGWKSASRYKDLE